MKPSPPYRVLQFLRWFCRDDYIEEIEGDLTELFEKQHETSPKRARWKFTRSVISFFRPEFIKSFRIPYHQNTMAMFRHNFLLTYRAFKRYKTTFFINLVGLSTGLACALLIYLWVQDEWHMDKFHEKDDRLYQVMEHMRHNGKTYTDIATSGPMAEALIREMPEVEYAAAVAPTHWPGFNSFTLSVGETNIRATGQYVGKDYFNIFSYGLIYGDADQVLSDKNSIVISEQLAMNLFNTIEGLMGKAVEFQHEREFLISGVFEQVPANSSVQFDFVLPFETYKDIKPWLNSWESRGPFVYVVTKEGTDIDQFNHKFAGFIKRIHENSTRYPFLKSYSENYLFNAYEDGAQTGGRIEYVRLFSAIAIFILLIACINFMNLSTARASRRLKEIGIKKVVGSGRRELIYQYLGESMLMAFASLIIAVLLVVLLLPQFNEITGKQLTLIFDESLVLAALSITLITGIAAGSYPALYLSGFKPIRILKGAPCAPRSAVRARKGLVVFQFTLSVILMVGIWVVYEQIEFVQNRHLGYEIDNVLYFNVEGKSKENMETFLREMKRIPGVVNASSTAHRMVGHNWSVGGLEWEGRDPDNTTGFQVAAVNYDFLETLGFELVEGRSFSRDFADDTQKIIFNETAIEAMGLSAPIGKTVHFMGKKEIIGIVKDFHYESLHEKLSPFFFIISPGSENKVMVRIAAGKERETIERLQNFYANYNPGFPFDYKFLDDDYQAKYTAEQRVASLSQYFTGLAILISCLGLFGLAAFTAERKLKEIGIRKILGSGVFGIIRLLSGDFTKMVLIAILIALPLSYFVASQWLESFAYRIELAWWLFVSSGLVALLIAWLTVGLQTLKAAMVNPVECLKDE